MRATGKIFLTALKNWHADNVFKHSAAVSFYTLFSLAPVTVIALAVAGFFLGPDRAGQEIQKQISHLVGPSSAELIQTAAEASSRQSDTVFATVVSIGLLIFGATTVFGQLQESMNQIWEVRPTPRRSGWVIMILQRLISFGMVLIVGFLLLVSLALSTWLTSALQHFRGDEIGSAMLLKGADFLVGMIVITSLFAFLFKILPDVIVPWRDVWTAGLGTALLFTAGRYLIALYLAHSTVASVYGAAGSLVALLIWVYYSCAILFFGVEFTRSLQLARGQPTRPKKTAVLENPPAKRTGTKAAASRSEN